MSESEIILGQAAFERRFGDLYHSLFQGSEPFKQSFRNASWQFVLTTNGFEWDHRGEFTTICNAVRSVGDSKMVWTNLEFESPRSVSCMLPLNYDAYVQAFKNAKLRWLYAGRKAIFGLSGSWGAIVDEAGMFISGGFAMIGGTAQFIGELASAWGGIDRMRGDFIAYLNDPAMSVPAHLRERLLEEVGWR